MKINGTISDSYGKLDGATIVMIRDGKRTNVAVVSDVNGIFEINSDDITENDKFEIRYIGYKTQLFNSAELKDKDVYLLEDVEVLDEVVLDFSKPKTVMEDKRKDSKKEWYKNPLFLLSAITLTTVVTIVIIIKKR